MKQNQFDALFSAIKAFGDDGKWPIASRLRQGFIIPIGTVEQKKAVAEYFTDPKMNAKAKSTRKTNVIDVKALFVAHGNEEQKKKAKEYLVKKGTVAGVAESPEFEIEPTAEDIQIVTDSWQTRASEKALELAHEYPLLDYSSLFDKDKIGVYDVKRIIKEQASDEEE